VSRDELMSTGRERWQRQLEGVRREYNMIDSQGR